MTDMPSARQRSVSASLLAALVLGLASGCSPAVSTDAEILARLPERVDFNFDVKPLFADRCYACHGPDENARQVGLRLDLQEAATATRLESGGFAVVGGSLRRSKLWRRISSTDASFRMPPADSHLALSPFEIALIGRWIEQGAEWKPHWAFIPPVRPDVPTAATAVGNPIDVFIADRLQREGLSPAPQADRERLIRRVSMDLTGLPPSIEEIDAFLADDSAAAYELVVDRLLHSSAYGERMAVDWLDLARYADSHGLHSDGFRSLWPWRDWVIRAFNDNMPFDRFVTWQLAGDLLPDPTRDQVLATAFQRNHPVSAEGGLVEEEFRLEYVFDRSESAARGLMGLTIECAKCHDHKFDPISQADYYRFAAFFNNVHELGLNGDDGNAGPTLPLPDAEIEAALADARQRIEAKEAEIEARRQRVSLDKFADVDALVDPWLADPAGLIARYPFDEIAEGAARNTVDPDRSASVSATVTSMPGSRGSAALFDHGYATVNLGDVAEFERTDPFSIALWANPRTDDEYRVLLGNAGQKADWWKGYELFLNEYNTLSVRMISALPHNYLHITTDERLSLDVWTHVAVTYDGSSSASGLRLYLGGRQVDASVQFDRLYKSIRARNPRTETLRGAPRAPRQELPRARR